MEKKGNQDIDLQIQNEMRIIEKAPGRHLNMIIVFKHGGLNNERYHIGTELRIMSLKMFIYGKVKSAL